MTTHDPQLLSQMEQHLQRFYRFPSPSMGFLARLEADLAESASSKPRRIFRWPFPNFPYRLKLVGASVLIAILLGALWWVGPQNAWASFLHFIGYAPSVGFVDLETTRVLSAPFQIEKEDALISVKQVVGTPTKTVILLHVYRPNLKSSWDYSNPMLRGVLQLSQNQFLTSNTMSITGDQAGLQVQMTFPPLSVDSEQVLLNLTITSPSPLTVRIPLHLQSAQRGTASESVVQTYAPDTPAQTRHDIMVRLLRVAQPQDATVLQLQITAPPGMSDGHPAGGQNPILYDNLGHVYLHHQDAIPQVNKTIISPPALASDRISLWEDAHAPLSELAQSLTYVIPELAFHTPVNEELTLDMGEHPHAGQTWSLDETFQVAGVRVHLSRARLVRNVARQRYELALEAESDINASQRLQLLDIQSPELFGNMISGDLYGRVYASLFTAADRPPTGLIHIQITGAQISIKGPWRFQWDIPGHDVAMMPAIQHPQAQASDQGVTLRLNSAVFTDRLIALQLDAETPPGQRFIDVAWQEKSGLRDEFRRRYDFNREMLWCWNEDAGNVAVDARSQRSLTPCTSYFPSRLTFQPASPLARRFTLDIPGVRLFIPDATAIDLSIPRYLTFDDAWHDHPAASWPVDISLTVAEQTIHFSQARLVDGTMPELQLVSDPMVIEPRQGRTLLSLVIDAIRADDQETLLSWRGATAVVEGVDCRSRPDLCAVAPKRWILHFTPVDGLPDDLPKTYHIAISGAEVVQSGRWRLSFER